MNAVKKNNNKNEQQVIADLTQAAQQQLAESGYYSAAFVFVDTDGPADAERYFVLILMDEPQGGIRTGGWVAAPPMTKLFRPRGEISFHAMAVHHLTPDDFCDDDPHCDEYRLREMFLPLPADVMVAHSARFERGFIADTAHGGLPWICTVRAEKPH